MPEWLSFFITIRCLRGQTFQLTKRRRFRLTRGDAPGHGLAEANDEITGEY